MYASTNPHVPAGQMDVDALLFDMATRSARAHAHLSRPVSNSSSTPIRRPASRIMKPGSAGNSPVRAQRRRALTCNRRSQYWSEVFPDGTQMPSSSQHLSPVDPRPVSWHPSSLRPSRYSSFYTSNHPPPLPSASYAAYHTVAVHGIPTPMTQPDLGSAELLPEHAFSLDTSGYTRPPSFEAYDLYVSKGYPPGMDMGLSFENNPDYAITQPLDAPAIPISHATQIWTESLPFLSSHTAPPTPDLLPIQNHSPAMWEQSAQSLPTKDDKPELVGMGLYDSPSINRSSLGESTLTAARPDSTGTGLKLEETWEPPPDAADDEEEDGNGGEDSASSSDSPSDAISHEDGSGAMDDTAMPDSQPSHGPSANYALSTNDWSNRSFFFDGDDGMMSMMSSMLGMGGPVHGAAYPGSIA